MKISCISDLHIRTKTDSGYINLLKFMRHPLVNDSDTIFLLGDIFDLMCGDHEEYLKEFEEYFELILSLMSKNKKLFYIEGNHDLHLKNLYFRFLERKKISKENLVVMKGFCDIKIEDKRVHLSHGDDIQLGNWGYKLYKSLIHSPPLGYLADKFIPLKLLNLIGKKASLYSRKKGSKNFDHTSIRDNFRVGAILKFQEGFDVVIAGHGHIKDDFKYICDDKVYRYLNNGLASDTCCFTHMTNSKLELIKLE